MYYKRIVCYAYIDAYSTHHCQHPEYTLVMCGLSLGQVHVLHRYLPTCVFLTGAPDSSAYICTCAYICTYVLQNIHVLSVYQVLENNQR